VGTDPDDDFCQTPGDPPPGTLIGPAAPPVSRSIARLGPERCSVQALVRSDSGVATAPPARRWLLIEQPGPWGRDALQESRFDRDVARRLADRARREGVRVQLVRRPGDRLADSGRRWAYVDTTPGRATAWWSARTSDAELLHVPWDGSIGSPAHQPLYLVCTHGGHDACCAVRGRPLARLLPAPGPADVWETSHLGGCRFAANIVVLPYGCYYGQVPGDGGVLVRAHEAGQVALPWLRGRVGLPLAAQAAQHHAREELGLLGVDDLPMRTVVPVPGAAAGGERFSVTLAGPDGEVVVVVESRTSDSDHQLTCAAVRPGRFRSWHRVTSTEADPGSTCG
jgi:hypothetical protein